MSRTQTSDLKTQRTQNLENLDLETTNTPQPHPSEKIEKIVWLENSVPPKSDSKTQTLKPPLPKNDVFSFCFWTWMWLLWVRH